MGDVFPFFHHSRIPILQSRYSTPDPRHFLFLGPPAPATLTRMKHKNATRPLQARSCSKKMKTRPIILTLFLVLTAGLSGCASIGPGTVARDRFDYTTAISDSWKAQMLLNVVKLRYGDAPVFLDVASVINQYGFQGTVGVSGSWFQNPANSLFGSASQNVTPRGSISTGRQ